MKLLLDTCSFLWLCSSPNLFSSAAKKALLNPDSTVFLSDVSVWEIALKHSKGKLILPLSPKKWIQKMVEYHDLVSCPIHPDYIYNSCVLPMHHQDPFDRLLIATAIHEKMTLLTPDPKVRDYRVQHLW